MGYSRCYKVCNVSLAQLLWRREDIAHPAVAPPNANAGAEKGLSAQIAVNSSQVYEKVYIKSRRYFPRNDVLD